MGEGNQPIKVCKHPNISPLSGEKLVVDSGVSASETDGVDGLVLWRGGGRGEKECTFVYWYLFEEGIEAYNGTSK